LVLVWLGVVVCGEPPQISASYSTDVVIQRFGSYTVNQTMYIDDKNQQVRFEEADNTTVEIENSQNNVGVRFVPESGDCYTTCFNSQRCPPDPNHKCSIEWPIIEWFEPLENASFTGYCTNGVLWESTAEQNNIIYQLTYCVSTNDSIPLYILFSVENKPFASVEFYNWISGVPTNPSLFQIPSNCPCTTNHTTQYTPTILPERTFITSINELLHEFTELYDNN